MITYRELVLTLEGKTTATQRRRNQRGFSHNEIKGEYNDRPSLVISVKRIRQNNKDQAKEQARLENDDNKTVKEELEDITEEELDDIISEELFLENKLNIKSRHDIALRFKKSEHSRETAEKKALSHKADSATIEHRAHKMAIMLMKKKLAKKPLDKLSVQEKEHLEDLIKKKANIINKIATKLKQKILKLERDRLEK